jgi:dTDP-4-dehydrorhamnose 3,5-epimerase
MESTVPFKFSHERLSGIVLINPRVFPDERGSFWECFKSSDFQAAGITDGFVQDNHSVSSANVIRGLHYQTPPHAQAKLVRCLVGAVYDVVVDIRVGSPTYGQHAGYCLSAENRKMLYIPPGFAHGFAVLSTTAEITYKVSHEYHAASEAGISWNDPELKIEWPIESPLISEKDQCYPGLCGAVNPFQFD